MLLLRIIDQIIEFVKKHKIISGILGVLLFFLLLQLNNPKTQTKTKTENQNKIDQNNSSETVNLKDHLLPTLSTAKTTPEPFDITNSDPQYPLEQFLPYEGKGFTVEKYLAPLVLEVKVKNKADISNIEPLLKAWLKDKELIKGENKITWKYGE